MKRWFICLFLLVSCGAIKPVATTQPAVPAPTQVAEPVIASPTSQPIRVAPTPTLQPSPTAQTSVQLILDEYVLSLKAGTELEARFDTLPHYAMTLDVDLPNETFVGSQIITYTNTTGTELHDLVLRSYSNFPPDVMGDGGDTRTEVISASSNGVPLDLKVEAQDTVYRVLLNDALAPNEAITLKTTFKGTLTAWPDGSYPFLSAYPMLAVWDNTAQAWRTDVTRFPDHVFAEAAFYDVQVQLPSTDQVFATGSALTSSDNGTTTTTRFVSAPVREWAASFGQFESVKASTNGITVTIYQTKQNHYDLERIRDMAIGSLESLETHVGAYPYRELDVHLMNWYGSAGIEYPAFVLILAPDQLTERIDFVVAHEVAHQWWYGLVGNDIYREAWLDESLANYSAYFVAADVLGADQAQGYYDQELWRLYQLGEQNGGAPAGLAIDEYASFRSYYQAVYGKGAIFLATLREEIGDQAFFAGLQSYYAKHTYGIGTRAAFKQAFEAASNRDLTALFDEWLGGE